MANEAVIIELYGDGGDVKRYTVADDTGIEKGTLMYLSGDNTISKTAADGDLFVGIAATEKVADDGQTTLGVYTHGKFDLKDSGSGMTLGDIAKIDGANLIATADLASAIQAGEYVGQVLETASASETVAVLVRK